MIILTAGHTGTGTGAQCATTQFDEGAETIWLRDRIAEILTNKYGLAVLIDNDTASLQLLTQSIQSASRLNNLDSEASSLSRTSTPKTSEASTTVDRRPLTVDDIIIDLHFNAHSNPQARGCETIVADDATELELRVASRLAHATADSLEIPLRCIKSESQTPHKRLAMLHLTPQSIILEVCFITSPDDAEAYRKNRHKLANKLAQTIAKLVKP